MGPNSIMAVGFLLLALIVGAAWVLGRVLNLNKNVRLCERCGGTLTPDAYRYKGVIVWDCEDCGDTFETLRGMDR